VRSRRNTCCPARIEVVLRFDVLLELFRRRERGLTNSALKSTDKGCTRGSAVWVLTAHGCSTAKRRTRSAKALLYSTASK
jgi:hypothetical protein